MGTFVHARHHHHELVLREAHDVSPGDDLALVVFDVGSRFEHRLDAVRNVDVANAEVVELLMPELGHCNRHHIRTLTPGSNIWWARLMVNRHPRCDVRNLL